MRTILLALSITTLAAVAAAPASAAPAPLVVSGQYARTAPFIDGTIYSIECDAVAPGAITTRIDSCKLADPSGLGYSAPAVSSQGPTARTNTLVAIPTYQWRLCWSGSATYADGSTQSAGGCTAVSPYTGAGASTS